MFYVPFLSSLCPRPRHPAISENMTKSYSKINTFNTRAKINIKSSLFIDLDLLTEVFNKPSNVYPKLDT